MSLKDYIVRIYRYQKDKPRKLVGLVEEVDASGKKAFTNYDELWEILNFEKHDSARKRKKREDVKVKITD